MIVQINTRDYLSSSRYDILPGVAKDRDIYPPGLPEQLYVQLRIRIY
jgi:hypothetical protein